MKGLIIHFEEYGAQLDMLNNEQTGLLLKALISVANGSEPVGDMDDLTRMCFSFMKDRMERDMALSKTRADAGRQGGLNSKPGAKESKAKQSEANEKQDQSPIPITNTDTDTDKEDICASDPAEELFRKVWAMYPNKKGLGAVSKSQKQKLLEIGEDHLIRALNRYMDERREKELRRDFCPNWQNGSTWFNSGFADYLDQNYQPAPPDPKQIKSSPIANFQPSEVNQDDIMYQIMDIQNQNQGKKS